MIRSRGVKNRFFLTKKPIFFHGCTPCSELPSNGSNMIKTSKKWSALELCFLLWVYSSIYNAVKWLFCLISEAPLQVYCSEQTRFLIYKMTIMYTHDNNQRGVKHFFFWFMQEWSVISKLKMAVLFEPPCIMKRMKDDSLI